MRSSLVVLLTDFGTQDPFVGMMKGVILSRAPKAAFLDLTHQVPPQDIRRGAFFLKAAAPYLPTGSLVVAVVDPGVGSARHILYARSRRLSFLAPDNGLLSWLPGPFLEVRRVTRAPAPGGARPSRAGSGRATESSRMSGTFHGRDAFAPIAAALLQGSRVSGLGPRVASWVRLRAPRRERRGAGLRGELVAFDRFGNGWTSLESGGLPPGAVVRFRGRALGPVRHHYAEAASGRALAVAGSFGVVELAVRNGDFARRFRARIGDPVEIQTPR